MGCSAEQHGRSTLQARAMAAAQHLGLCQVCADPCTRACLCVLAAVCSSKQANRESWHRRQGLSSLGAPAAAQLAGTCCKLAGEPRSATLVLTRDVVRKLSEPTLVLPAVLSSGQMSYCWPAVCREKADPKSTGSVGAPMGGQVIEVMAEPGGQLHWKLP